jgi:hypothetical protein
MVARKSKGPRGERGARGAPQITPQKLAGLIASMEEVHAEAAVQFRRTARRQAQIDRILRALEVAEASVPGGHE